jgi:hypothetical protein
MKQKGFEIFEAFLIGKLKQILSWNFKLLPWVNQIGIFDNIFVGFKNLLPSHARVVFGDFAQCIASFYRVHIGCCYDVNVQHQIS